MVLAVSDWLADLMRGLVLDDLFSIFWDPPWIGYVHYSSGWWDGVKATVLAEFLLLFLLWLGARWSQARSRWD